MTISPYSNGIVERLNGTIKNAFIKELQGTYWKSQNQLSKKQLKIDIEYVVNCYNGIPHTSTDKRPSYLFDHKDLPEHEEYTVHKLQVEVLTRDGARLFRYPDELLDLKQIRHQDIALSQITKLSDRGKTNEPPAPGDRLFLTFFCHHRSANIYPMTNNEKTNVK